MNNPMVRKHGLAWGLDKCWSSFGLILVYGVGGYWLICDVFQDPEAPWFVKFGVPAIVVGLTILFFTVLAQRLRAAKSDKYVDIED